MKNKILAVAATLFLAGNAYAAEVEGSVGVEFTENTAGDVVSTTTLDLGITGIGGQAFGSVGLESTDSETLTVDTYQIGTTVNGVTLSYGKQEDLFSSPGLEVIGGETLATPGDDFESLRVSFGALALQVGLTDVSTDASEVENVQAAYGLQVGIVSVDTAVDYNIDAEQYTVVVGGSVDTEIATFGLDVSHDETTAAYELSASNWGVTGFVNGDENNSVQNIGAGYASDFGGVSFYLEAGYNVDTEETTPAAGISFSF